MPDVDQKLVVARMVTRMYLLPAIEAAYVKDFAMRLFGADESLFRRSPSATMTYRALDALEENCIVHICERLQNAQPDMIGETAPFRRAFELLAHRTAISHPGRLTWRKEWMADFHRAGRPETDHRGSFLYDLLKSLDELPAGGYDVSQFQPGVRAEMSALLRQIWLASMKDPTLVPSEDRLQELLVTQWPTYVAELEKNPTGELFEGTHSPNGIYR